MQRVLIQLVLLSVSLFRAGEILANTPEQVVMAFQHDYKIWNDQTFQQSQTHDGKDIMPLAQKSWNQLLKKYTAPDFEGEPIAFGSESSHDPDLEKVISTKITGDNAVVTTRLSQQYYSPVYEYQLFRDINTWYLSQIFLVDDDGKYPSL